MKRTARERHAKLCEFYRTQSERKRHTLGNKKARRMLSKLTPAELEKLKNGQNPFAVQDGAQSTGQVPAQASESHPDQTLRQEEVTVKL